MNLAVIALDYDGTIARHDVLPAAVRDAIAAARCTGIVVLVVTGRTLDDLRRVAGDLHFADGIVAENGAVIHFPESGHTSILAPRLEQDFVAELTRRGIRFGAGRCVVDADANEAPRLLEAIHELEQPLVLIFNAARVMVLPQGVSKATGLRVALDTLRLSPRNTVAIGDAENDHELLRLAEVGVAVEWGSPALRAAADVVLPGDGPGAVAAYVRTLAEGRRLPVPARARRRVLLGYDEDGSEFSLAVRGRNMLVAGDAKSGKSWVAGLLCEQLIMQDYCVCVIDPEGDYTSLEALPGVTVLGGEDPPPTPREVQRALRYPDRSVVIDLSRCPHEEKVQHARALLLSLKVLREQTGLPHRIVIDEAHYYLQGVNATQFLDLERDGYIIVTYWASRLPDELLADTEVMVLTRQSNPAEIDALCGYCLLKGADIDCTEWSLLSQLESGRAAALPITEEASRALRVFTVASRLTPHVRHREKYTDVPVADYRAFYFSGDGRHPARHARTLRQFVGELERAPGMSLEPYLRRGDFSRWIAGVFGDHALAVEIRALEDRYRAAGRAETALDIANAIRARYEMADDIVPATATDSRP